MKNYLKLGILLLGISFGLIYCKEDPISLEEHHHVHNDSPYSISRVDCDEIERNILLISSLEDLNLALQKAQLKTKSGSDEPDAYDFTIDTESANYLENKEGTYHSYTFAIKRDYDYGYLENLLLSYNGTLGYKVYLIKYDLTSAEKEIYFSGKYIDLTDKVKTIELDISNLVIDFRAKQFTCVWILSEWCRQGNHNSETGFDKCLAYASEVTSGGCTGSGGGNSGDFSGGGGNSGEGGSGDNSGTGGSGGGGTSGNPDVTTPTDCKYDCPPELDAQEPTIDKKNCEKLQDMLDPAKANIKETITELEGTLNQTGENGASFKKNNGLYTNDRLPATSGNSIDIPKGDKSPGAYGGIHTHPASCYPMFSYSDIFNLYQLHSNAESDMKSDAVFMLVCKDDNGNDQTYAIKVENINMLRAKIVTDFQKPICKNMLSYADKVKSMDKELKKEFVDNSDDPERAFLNFFKDYSVSLYKADTDGNSFNKLNLANPGSNTSAINEIPCNELIKN